MELFNSRSFTLKKKQNLHTIVYYGGKTTKIISFICLFSVLFKDKIYFMGQITHFSNWKRAECLKLSFVSISFLMQSFILESIKNGHFKVHFFYYIQLSITKIPKRVHSGVFNKTRTCGHTMCVWWTKFLRRRNNTFILSLPHCSLVC